MLFRFVENPIGNNEKKADPNLKQRIATGCFNNDLLHLALLNYPLLELHHNP